MTSRISKWILLSAAAVAVVVAVVLIASPRHATRPLPDPNGYDDLKKAGAMIATEPADLDTLKEDELVKLTTANAEGLKLARSGLSKECRVVLPSSQTAMQDHIDELAKLKGLARAFLAEIRLAELRNNTPQAATNCLDLIQTGLQLSSGGVLIDVLVATAIENQGVTRLQKLAPKLDAKTCKWAASRLEEMETKRVPVSDTLKEEAAWVRRVYGFRGQIVKILTASSTKKGEQNFVSKSSQQAMRARELLMTLAARAYELDQGKPPPDSAALVPGYLKAVPKDPNSGANMNLPR